MATLRRKAESRLAVLERLFALPSAARALATDLGFVASGQGSLCFRAIEARSFRDIQYDVRDWLDRDAEKTKPTEITEDAYGFTWLVVHRPPARFESVVDDLYRACVRFEEGGFGAQLLCAVSGFLDRGNRQVALIYLCTPGTFYPFAPLPGERRNNELELACSRSVEGTLRVEKDLRRWYPIWGASGLGERPDDQ